MLNMNKFLRKYISFLSILTMFQNVILASEAQKDAPAMIESKVGTFVNIIAYFGYAVALGMLAYIAMKYMMSAASDRANMKQGAINYLIGAFLIAGASTIATAVVSIVANDKGADGIAGDIIGAGGFGAGNQ